MNNRAPDPRGTAQQLQRLSLLRPSLGMILGSGFHHVVKELETDAEVPVRKLKGFPPTAVAGHAGKVLIGRLGGVPVTLLVGRSHYYEGHSMAAVTFPIRVLAAAGIKALLLTNAAGGISVRSRPGSFMVLNDHINFMGINPLRGLAEASADPFVDLTRVYDAKLQRQLREAAKAAGARVHSGVYLAVSGPSYETPAEIRTFAHWGADAVGMSTVPEAIIARQCGLRVAGLSCITNRAAWRARRPLSHAEVLENSDRVRVLASKLLTNFAKRYGETC